MSTSVVVVPNRKFCAAKQRHCVCYDLVKYDSALCELLDPCLQQFNLVLALDTHAVGNGVVKGFKMLKQPQAAAAQRFEIFAELVLAELSRSCSQQFIHCCPYAEN